MDSNTPENDLRAVLRGFEKEEAAMSRADGWQNSVSGAGVRGLDKSIASTFVRGCRLNDEQLAAMYSFEDLSAKIVDVYPREGMREGFELGGLEGQEEAVCDYLAAFEVDAVLTEAWIWGRLFGGSAIWLGVNDPDPSQPLGAYTRVEFLQVIDRRWLNPSDYDVIGRPTRYNVTPPGRRKPIGQIHASRLVIFPGARTEEQAKQAELLGWDYSVLQRPFEALRQDGSIWTNVGALIEEASVGIFKLEGLFALVGSGNANASMQRYGVINRVKSIYRAIVLDKSKEEYDRKDQTFAGLADLTDRAIKRVASAAEMPVTVLMGEAPAGLNATGDSDLRWFFARIKAERKLIAEPRLRRLITLLLAATDSPMRGTTYKPQIVWPELWSPTAKEASEVYYTNMQGDALAIDKQIATPDEIFLARQGRDGWSPTLAFGTEARGARQEAVDVAYKPETEPVASGTEVAQGVQQTPVGQLPDGSAKPADTAMNGAQVSSLVDVVTQAAAGTIPPESASAILELAFNLSPDDAKRVLGSAGTTFKVEKPEPNASPFASGKPDVPPNGQEPAEPGSGEGTPPDGDPG